MGAELEALKDWVGRSVTASETVTAPPVARLAATLGMPVPASKPGDPLPPGWHVLYFLPAYGPDRMREDGSPAGGGVSPPVPLPRYRLGLDACEFPGTLRIGDDLRRTTRISDLSVGGTADAPLVTMIQASEIAGPRGIAVREEREFIYFGERTPPPAPVPALPAVAWSRVVTPTPVLLFRYSALRFNSHRVHYDRDYAVQKERLPGLIVHSTLVWQLLLELCREALPERHVVAFRPHTRHPVYDIGPFTLCGAPQGEDSALFWALDPGGSVAITAEARLAV
jgi:3-methylfumaryl-CoA hydratase